MRRVAILAIVLAGGAVSSVAVAAQAWAAEPTSQDYALKEAAFAPRAARAPADPIGNLLERDTNLLRPGDLPFSARTASDPRHDDVFVIRNWPNLLRFDDGPLAVD